MNNVTFPVSKVSMVEDFLPEGYSTLSGISHAIVREDTNKILHYCSEDYALISNREIIESFSKFLGDQNYKFDLHESGYGDVRFRLQFALKDRRTNIQVGDTIAPVLVVYNSYNGSQRYRFMMRIMRLICSNGMTTWEETEALNLLHTPGADDGIAVEKSLGLINNFLPQFDDIIEPYYELAEQQVKNVQDRVDEIIEGTSFPISFRDDVIAQITKEAKQLKVGVLNDWLVYNGFNYMLNHVTENYLGRKGDKIDKQVLDYVLSY